MHTRAWLALLLGSLALAGCAADEDGTESTTDDAPDGDAGGGDARWGAYRFDERVEPRSGGAGHIQGYSYRHTTGGEGDTRTLDVDVEVLGISTEAIRGQSYDFSSGATEPTTTTANVEVAKLRHTLTVVRDDTGELTEGARAVATLWMPTDEAASTAAALWQFVHLDFEEDGKTGVWETIPLAEGDTTMTAPYTEGEDPSGWWGFEHLMTTYALAWWGALFEEGTLEEGSHAFGGFQYEADRETLEVSDYAFDGWRVRWSATSGDDAGSYEIAVAPELPLPIAHKYSSTTAGDTERWEYDLTGLELG